MDYPLAAKFLGFLLCLFVAGGITFLVVVIPLKAFASEKISRLFEGAKATLAVWLLSSFVLAAYIFINHKDFSGGAGDSCEVSQTEHRC